MPKKIVATTLILLLFAILIAVAQDGDTATEEPTGPTTIWDGVYTEEQAERGGSAYGICAECHGRDGMTGADPDMPSSPPIAGPLFLRDWAERPLLILFEYSRSTMPQYNPGSLSDQEYIDAIAYILQLSGAPAGEQELVPTTEALIPIMITMKPEEASE